MTRGTWCVSPSVFLPGAPLYGLQASQDGAHIVFILVPRILRTFVVTFIRLIAENRHNLCCLVAPRRVVIMPLIIALFEDIYDAIYDILTHFHLSDTTP